MPRLFPLLVVIQLATFCCLAEAQNPGRIATNPQAKMQPIESRPQPAAAAVRLPGQPDWFPLDPQHEKYLTEILKFWEFQAGQVQRYRCKFVRWEYDPVILPRHPAVAATVAEGQIQYAAPDKGLFEVKKAWDVVKDKQTGDPTLKDGKAEYAPRTEVFDEHWICDGKSIFQIDGRNKQIVQRPLPPEMQGKHIAEGPLPFLFGAKVETIKEQYWIHVLPPEKKGRFHLEAIPKQRQQAADFKALHIFIDEKEFLPEALILFDRVGGHATYEFQEREKNWNLLPEKLNPFHQQFFAPKLPTGWKMVTEPFQMIQATAGQPRALQQPAPQQVAPQQVAPQQSSAAPRQAIRQMAPSTQRR